MKNKTLLIPIAVAALSSSSLALTPKDVYGKYSITARDVPVQNIITLSPGGLVSLVEFDFEGELTCKGKWKMKNDIITSKVTCENGESFSQRINLSGITNLDKFAAKIYSTAYQQEMPVTFERLRK